MMPTCPWCRAEAAEDEHGRYCPKCEPRCSWCGEPLTVDDEPFTKEKDEYGDWIYHQDCYTESKTTRKETKACTRG